MTVASTAPPTTTSCFRAAGLRPILLDSELADLLAEVRDWPAWFHDADGAPTGAYAACHPAYAPSYLTVVYPPAPPSTAIALRLPTGQHRLVRPDSPVYDTEPVSDDTLVRVRDGLADLDVHEAELVDDAPPLGRRAVRDEAEVDRLLDGLVDGTREMPATHTGRAAARTPRKAKRKRWGGPARDAGRARLDPVLWPILACIGLFWIVVALAAATAG